MVVGSGWCTFGLAPWVRDLLGLCPTERGPGLLCPDPPWLWVCFTSLAYLSLKLASMELDEVSLGVNVTLKQLPADLGVCQLKMN
jgi:hypothetical protein